MKVDFGVWIKLKNSGGTLAPPENQINYRTA